MKFTDADTLFRKDLLNDLAGSPDGRRFLKLRSLSRSGQLEQLFAAAKIDLPDVGARALFQAAYEANISTKAIEACIRDLYKADRKARKADEANLVNQLYKINEFNWGGLHQNSLEKTIVDNYVKKITRYDVLCSAIENELLNSMRGYVLCSWYNHWTSIIIEDIFRDHANVLPAIGQVKKIDFFLRDVPFDLKVTYLPEGYLSEKRRDAGLRPEATLLKRVARSHKLPIDNELPAAALLQDLWAKVSDSPAKESQQVISDLVKFREETVVEIGKDPSELICWLYENQGVGRFDASNRLFLILVDQRNYFDSWKLKRAKPLLEEQINHYLDNCGDDPGQDVEFTWEGSTYSTRSDVIVVRHKTAEPRG